MKSKVYNIEVTEYHSDGSDDVKVNSAELKDGLLTISCERIIPEHKKKKLIEIK